MKNTIVEMRNSWDEFDIRREDLLIIRNSSECLRDMGTDNMAEVKRWVSEQGLKYVSLEFQEIIKLY